VIHLENLADGSISDRNFQKLKALVPDSGGQTAGFRFGVVVVTFTASATSSVETVTHGLGKLPVAIVLSSETTSDLRATYSAVDAAEFDVKAFSGIGSITGPLTVSWLVIG
jgi:hypothetical protein